MVRGRATPPFHRSGAVRRESPSRKKLLDLMRTFRHLTLKMRRQPHDEGSYRNRRRAAHPLRRRAPTTSPSTRRQPAPTSCRRKDPRSMKASLLVPARGSASAARSSCADFGTGEMSADLTIPSLGSGNATSPPEHFTPVDDIVVNGKKQAATYTLTQGVFFSPDEPFIAINGSFSGKKGEDTVGSLTSTF